MSQPTFNQNRFQFQENTSNVNAATSLLGAEDVTFSGSVALDTTYFLRIQISNTGAKTGGGDAFELQYNVDGGGYAGVSAASSNVIAVDGLATDQDATTRLLSDDAGLVDQEGFYSETGTSASLDVSISAQTELVYAIQFVSTDLTTGSEEVHFRLLEGIEVFDNYNVTPAAIMPAASGPTEFTSSVAVGIAQAITAQVGPAIDREKHIDFPAVSQAEARGYTPTVDAGGDVTYEVTPTEGKVNARGFVPTVTKLVELSVTPSEGKANARGFAPAVAKQNTAAPTEGKANARGFAPSVTKQNTVTPTEGKATAKGFAPTVTVEYTAAPTEGKANATGAAPTVTKLGTFSVTTIEGKANAVTAQVGPTVGVINFIEFGDTGKSHATGAAPTVAESGQFSVTPTEGKATARGFAPTVTKRNTAAPTEGKANATGSAPTVAKLGQFSVTPTEGKANATGAVPTVTEGQGVFSVTPTEGKANAVTAQVGPDIDRNKHIDFGDIGKTHATGAVPNVSDLEDVITGKANAVGFVPVVNATGGLRAVTTTEGKANARFSGVTPTIDVDVTLVGSQTGKTNARGFVPTITKLEVVTPTEGKANAVTAQVGPTLVVTNFIEFGDTGKAHAKGERPIEPIVGETPETGKANARFGGVTPKITVVTTLDGPDEGKTQAKGLEPTISLTPGESPPGPEFRVAGSTGFARATGEKPYGPLRRVPQVGVVRAKGAAPTVLKRIERTPTTGKAQAKGAAPAVVYVFEPRLDPLPGRANATGSARIITFSTPRYPKVGKANAIGLAPEVAVEGQRAAEQEQTAGTGIYDEIEAQQRQEDELILDVITQFVSEVA